MRILARGSAFSYCWTGRTAQTFDIKELHSLTSSHLFGLRVALFIDIGTHIISESSSALSYFMNRIIQEILILLLLVVTVVVTMTNTTTTTTTVDSIAKGLAYSALCTHSALFSGNKPLPCKANRIVVAPRAFVVAPVVHMDW